MVAAPIKTRIANVQTANNVPNIPVNSYDTIFSKLIILTNIDFTGIAKYIFDIAKIRI